MPAKRLELRERAIIDIDAATDHYLAGGGAALALRFVDAVEHELRRIGRSPRHAGDGAAALEVSDEDRVVLERWARSTAEPHRWGGSDRAGPAA